MQLSPFLQLALGIAIIIVAAKAAGYLSIRLGQPSVLGELLVGILLGPSVIDLAHLSFFSSETLAETIHELGELGVLLLMFIAGLELHLEDLTRNTKASAFAGVLGVIVPVGMGIGVVSFFDFDINQALFMGLTLGATSVSISAQTLMELKVLRSRVGLGLLGAAVFDDVLVILLLSGFLAVVSGGGSLLGLLFILLRMVLFLALSVAFGIYVLPGLARLVSRLPISQGVLTLALAVMLVYGVAAEVFGGMAAITGAFLAGLMFARSREKERIEHGVSALAYGLFVPIFFVNIGLSVNVRSLHLDALWLTLAIIVVAVISKLVGSGIGAKLGGFSWLESVQLGAGMISRGEVGLIVANVGIAEGLVNESEFSAIVGMVLVTTIITPPILRALFRQKEKSEPKISPPRPKPA